VEHVALFTTVKAFFVNTAQIKTGLLLWN